VDTPAVNVKKERPMNAQVINVTGVLLGKCALCLMTQAMSSVSITHLLQSNPITNIKRTVY